MTKVALLFSHFPKRFCGNDQPMLQLKSALDFLKRQRVTIITSVGQTHWDCILTASLEYGVPVHLVIVKPVTLQDVCEQFLCQFDSYHVVESRTARDTFICSNAERLYPLWLRKNGRLAEIIASLTATSADWAERLDFCFDCSSYRFPDSGLKYLLTAPSVELSSLPDDYLWHWTRGRDGGWAGETRREYCHALLHSNSPPRNALETLCRILKEQKIRASGFHIAGHLPVTSFTENHPARSASMFTWRKDEQRMNFEPYGLGISRGEAYRKGVRPLKYGTTPQWDTMKFNNHWKNESEWRGQNDFILDEECFKKMIVVVRKKQEIKQIQTIFAGRIVAYEQ